MPTPTASQPDPQWYIAKMRDLYDRDPQLLDPSWRAYFSTESAPPQLRAKRPAIPEGTPTPESASAPTDHAIPASVTPPTLDIEDDVPDASRQPDAHVISVTRSDLPPAPPAAVAEATSPYTRQQHGRAAFTLFQGAPEKKASLYWLNATSAAIRRPHLPTLFGGRGWAFEKRGQA